MKICIISGSPRRMSNTLKFCKALRNALLEHGEPAEIITFDEYDIPLSNQGTVEMSHLSPFQEKLIRTVSESHLVFICSPEYNWMPTAEIVNMFHQLGAREFKPFFDNKVFGVAGVSDGKGGKMPCLQITYVLNKLINFLDCNSTVSARNFESHFTNKELDDDGHILGNEIYSRGIKGFVDFALRTAHRWHPQL
jgi:chromate reductase